MASFDLVCNECGHEFEIYVQGFLRDDDRVCPKCDATDVRQKFSGFLRNLGCSAPAGSGFG
jgi:putative FmdB family regulatory protein